MVKKFDDVLNALSANRQEKIEQRQIELAQEAINHYEKTGLHVTLSEMKAWLDAKKTDKKAPLPVCHL